MIAADCVGRTLGPFTADIEAGQLRLFAKATGQVNPLFLDEGAARAAGYRGLLAPPTFPICAFMLGQTDPMDLFRSLGVDVARMLHAEQRFDYTGPICAGDRITTRGTVSAVTARKGGALTFVTLALDAINQLDEKVAMQQLTVAVRAATSA